MHSMADRGMSNDMLKHFAGHVGTYVELRSIYSALFALGIERKSQLVLNAPMAKYGHEEAEAY